MKELTIEQKAKRYDEVIELVNSKWHYRNQPCIIDVSEIFPELKESEDERIRKNLIELFHDTVSNDEIFSDYGLDKTKVLAWLEKQGEQEEPQVYETENGEVITYSKSKGYKVIEPKFHEGEWIVTDKNNVVQIKAIENDKYVLENTMRFSIDYVDKCWHLWTIQDAKDGDVLITNKKQPFIFNGHYDEDTDYIYAYCGIADIVKDDSFYIEEECVVEEFKLWCTNENVCPATKEQRDTLMKAMTDAGWEFDFEKKELKKVENEEYNGEDYGIDSLYHAQRILEETLGKVDGYQSDDGILEHKCAITAINKLYEKKSAWSEEDDAYKLFVISAIEDYYDKKNPLQKDLINWIKSLKYRIGE